jgi:hypothetical protein
MCGSSSLLIFAQAAQPDGWGIKLLAAVLGGVVATFVGFLLNQRHQDYKEKVKELKEYIVALQAAADELEFYGYKLNQLSSELAGLAKKVEEWSVDWIVPSYSIYPNFLEKCKSTIYTFYKNPTLVKDVGHCHFELCHILERLNLMRRELRAPLESEGAARTKQLRVHLFNVNGFKGLVDSNIPVFKRVREAILSERKQIEKELEIRREQSLIPGSE